MATSVVHEIDAGSYQGHVARAIRAGDRHDVILRLLAVDQSGWRCSWADKSPATYQHRWVTSEEIEWELKGEGYKSRALATVISLGCRPHLEARWPGWTIANKQECVAGLRVSSYRIAQCGGAAGLSQATVPTARVRSPQAKAGRPAVQPKLFDTEWSR